MTTHLPQSSVDDTSARMRALVGALALTGLVVTGGIVFWPMAEPTTAKTTEKPLELSVVPLPTVPNPFASVSLEANAAIVYDLTTATPLYTLDEREPLPLASLTKLMTALVAYEAAPDGQVRVSPYALQTEGDSGFAVNEAWNVKDLVRFMLVTSSNDGAGALAAAAGSSLSTRSHLSEDAEVAAFVGEMNNRAQTLGMRDTQFFNATGLDVNFKPGAQGSARDVAVLLGHLHLHTPDLLEDTSRVRTEYVSGSGRAHTARNTNEYVGDIPGLRGSKTGYTDLAGGNLAVVYDAGLNQPVVVVVLGSSLEGRFRDVHKLVEATNAYMVGGWYEHTAGSTARTNP